MSVATSAGVTGQSSRDWPSTLQSRPPTSLGPRHRILFTVLVASLMVLLSAQLALATNNVDRKWLKDQAHGVDHYIETKFDSGFPSNSTMRDYVKNGRSEWNNVGRQLFFAWNQSSTSARVLVRYNDLWWPYDDKLAVASYSICYHTQWICNGEITFNKTISGGWQHWYGQGTLNCANKYVDLWSTSAHEFGHLVALHHSNQSADTMYASIPCGSTSKRSLTTHDKDGIKYWYAAR